MTCPVCDGTGWLRRSVPHPGIHGCMVTATKVCPKCEGKGKIPDSGNLFAQDSTKEKDSSFHA
jgi:DnaJ-class molecular chaperone